MYQIFQDDTQEDDTLLEYDTQEIGEKLCGPNVGKIFRVKITQIEMLKDRDYNVSLDQQWLDIKLKSTAAQQYVDFCSRLAQTKNMTVREVMTSCYTSNDGTHQIFVYYPETPADGKSIGIDIIKNVVSNMEKEKISSTIIISDVPLSSNAQQIFNTLPSFNMEHFLYRELMNNVTKYYLSPKHTLLTPNDIQLLLKISKDHNINIEQFPKLSIHDPIVRYYGAQPGDIFKVHRFVIGYDAMVPNYLAYRIVTIERFVKLTNLADKSADKAI